MPYTEQISIEDYESQQVISRQPKRVAYIDECGSFGFNFTNEGNSQYYVLTAIVIKESDIEELHCKFEGIRKTNGFANAELKSSRLSDNKRRRIINQTLDLPYRVVLFVVDKQQLQEDSPLVNYKQTFLKYLPGQMYQILYQAYPRLDIMMDEFGYSEFQDSFRDYTEKQREQLSFLNEYDFQFVNSKDEIMIQLADVIGGSITKYLRKGIETNYFEILKGKIEFVKQFPERKTPYWGKVNPEEYKYDEAVFSLSVKTAKDFIEKYRLDDSDERKAQIAVIKYLLFYVFNVSSTSYVYSDELVDVIQQHINRSVKKNYLFRRVIAPLRDQHVILASCPQGYKIPVSVEDIITYLNQTTAVTGPMLQRMGICRDMIIKGTDGELDVFNDAAFVKYKKYFE